MRQEHDEIEIDMREIWYVLKKKMALIVAITVLFGAAAGAYSYYMIQPLFSSTSKIYVMNRTNEQVSISDLNVSTGLTSDYVELIQSKAVLDQVVSNLGLNIKSDELLQIMSISNPTNTRVLSITVKCGDAVLAQKIVNNIVAVSRDTISEIMQTSKPSVIQEATLNEKKVYPSNMKFAAIAAVLGLLLSAGLVTLLHILDDTVKTSDDIERYLGLNTLAFIPDDMDGVKGANKKATRWGRLSRRKED